VIARFNDSPALRKLFRNRLAVVAMGIIALYMLVFVWILAMEVVSKVGEQTGAFDLRTRPVLGALLPDRTLERVGPAGLPGFGGEARPEVRTEQILFLLENADRAISAAERHDGADGRTQAEILAEQLRFAERRLADLPLPELRAAYDRAAERFSAQSDLRVLRSNLVKLRLAVEATRDFAERARDPERAGQRALNLDETLRSMEEIAFLLEDLAPRVPPDSALAGLDPEAFFAAADAIGAEPTPDPLYDGAMLDAVSDAVRERLRGLDAEIDAKLDQMEPMVLDLLPMPTGLDGFLYDVRLLLGTDRQGRSILIRAVYSAKVAIQVGVIVSVFAVGFGSLIGAAAGYFGGWVDHAVIWLYSTLSSIPDLVLLVVLAFMFSGSSWERTLVPLYVAFALTYWIGPCRVTRGESLKLKQLDYVQAANALGAGRARILTRHIIPNTAHLVFINLSLLFIAAIKGEVVLTFLGLGLKEGASWGIMVDQSRAEVVSGFFWQIGAATFFMFVLVLAFNVLTDALQDAFDPKHVG
jgi:peptide/nickel transport system permease protein